MGMRIFLAQSQQMVQMICLYINKLTNKISSLRFLLVEIALCNVVPILQGMDGDRRQP